MNFICYSCETNNTENIIKELERIAEKVRKKSKGKKLSKEERTYNLGIDVFLSHIAEGTICQGKQMLFLCVLCGREITGGKYLSQEGLCEYCRKCKESE